MFVAQITGTSMRRGCTLLSVLTLAASFSEIRGAAYAAQINFDEIKKSIVCVQTPRRAGTGLLISADGYILTSRHVVLEKQDKFYERTPTLDTQIRVGTTCKANYSESFGHKAFVVDDRPTLDLVLLKIDEIDNGWKEIKQGGLVSTRNTGQAIAVFDNVSIVGFTNSEAGPEGLSAKIKSAAGAQWGIDHNAGGQVLLEGSPIYTSDGGAVVGIMTDTNSFVPIELAETLIAPIRLDFLDAGMRNFMNKVVAYFTSFNFKLSSTHVEEELVFYKGTDDPATIDCVWTEYPKNLHQHQLYSVFNNQQGPHNPMISSTQKYTFEIPRHTDKSYLDAPHTPPHNQEWSLRIGVDPDKSSPVPSEPFTAVGTKVKKPGRTLPQTASSPSSSPSPQPDYAIDATCRVRVLGPALFKQEAQ